MVLKIKLDLLDELRPFNQHNFSLLEIFFLSYSGFNHLNYLVRLKKKLKLDLIKIKNHF